MNITLLSPRIIKGVSVFDHAYGPEIIVTQIKGKLINIESRVDS